MFFKNEFTIKPLDLGESNNIQFVFSKENTLMKIELAKIPKEESEKSGMPEDLKARVVYECTLDGSIESDFKKMKQTIPEELSPLIKKISNEINSTLKRTLRSIRWVRGLTGSHNLIRNASFMSWSSDGTKWHTIPPQLKLNISLMFPVKKVISDEEKILIHDLVIQEVDEPLGHELFFEAYSQKGENQRSALVIAIAAAETGFKQFVQKTSPETSWLLENVQSPPLIKMLNKYLPNLPVKRKIKGNVVLVPKDILKAIETGVEIRNKIVHGGKADIKHDTLEWVLRSVRDLLFLLDFYSGLEWAQKNISDVTKRELIKAAK